VARDYEPRCPAITSKGEPCQGYVHPGKEFCPAHDPARAEARKAAASKAGRVRTHVEFKEVKAQLRQLADDVLVGRQNRADAAVVSQVLGVWAKVAEAEVRLRQLEEAQLVETQLRVREQEELTKRLEELEDLLAEKNGGRRGWGA
jgi:hypothetical protein